MTYSEIIEKLKEVYEDVSSFAYNENIVPPHFQFSEEVQKQRQILADFEHERELLVQKKKEEHGVKNEWNLPKEVRQEIRTLKRPLAPYEKEREEYLHSLDLYFKEVESYGGEDMGSMWYKIYYFPDHDVHIKVEGYYQSYNGTEFYDGWDCCKEVKPVTKQVIVYE